MDEDRNVPILSEMFEQRIVRTLFAGWNALVNLAEKQCEFTVQTFTDDRTFKLKLRHPRESARREQDYSCSRVTMISLCLFPLQKSFIPSPFNKSAQSFKLCRLHRISSSGRNDKEKVFSPNPS